MIILETRRHTTQSKRPLLPGSDLSRVRAQQLDALRLAMVRSNVEGGLSSAVRYLNSTILQELLYHRTVPPWLGVTFLYVTTLSYSINIYAFEQQIPRHEAGTCWMLIDFDNKYPTL